MKTFGWLLKREFWEHRGGFFWVPLWTGVVVIVLALIALVRGAVKSAEFTAYLQHASAHDLQRMALTDGGTLLILAVLFHIVIAFVLFFYLLGALYDDRRDRSVLFWKSLPVADWQTVFSKAVMALVVVPLLVTAFTLATWLIVQVLISVALAVLGHNPFTLIWGQSVFYRGIGLLLAAWPGTWLLVMLPTAGWLLLCSAWSSSKPFLWALLIPIIPGAALASFNALGITDVSLHFVWREIIARMLLGTFGFPSDNGAGAFQQRAGSFTLTTGLHDLYLDPGLWIAAAAGVVLIALAVWARRRGSDI